MTVNLYGHNGAASPIEPQRYEPREIVSVFDSIRREINTDKWFVCGTSLGGALSIRYALTHPDQLYGHIFTNSNSAFATSQQTVQWQQNAQESHDRIIHGGKQALDRIPVHPRHARRLSDGIKERLTADSQTHDPVGIANVSCYMTPFTSVRDLVHENRKPALLVCGRHEKRFHEARQFVAETMPHLTIADVDAGHAVNMQAVDAFNTAVLEFLITHHV